LLDKRFSSFQHDPGDPNSISDNTTMCIFEERSGILWVGTWGGVNKFDPRTEIFRNFYVADGLLSNDGIWNEKGASLKIIIIPPWWRTNCR